ncbi:MAG: cysteine synthase family protein [Planctomycetota bacterium]|nr:MAG: cysteine synthase family protein [Planctomycetota bacterium]REK22186.1 MAG: cysteine synthase family protein [Planctomycetota bacterium]REK44292.1 MAG: cysteine synthase family protein [Planctomycetota bacterium]
MSRSDRVLASIVEAIGDTPLLELHRLADQLGGRVLAKLEYLNPGFSKKDRIAREIIAEAETAGDLRPGRTVVELTSGNTGTGLALVCRAKGYPCVCVMSRGNSPERARMMRALGAEVVLVEQVPGATSGQVSGDDLALVEERTQQIVRERDAFRVDQFVREASALAHSRHTAQEIIRQTGGDFDAFCDFVGTGGSFGGCAAAMKAHHDDILCYVVEPQGAATLAGEAVTKPHHKIQGGGYCRAELPLIDTALVDGYLTVTDEETIAWARRLAEIEGVFGGFSGGANVAAAAQLLAGPCRGKTIVTLICDSGLKYLSTDLWPQ